MLPLGGGLLLAVRPCCNAAVMSQTQDRTTKCPLCRAPALPEEGCDHEPAAAAASSEAVQDAAVQRGHAVAAPSGEGNGGVPPAGAPPADGDAAADAQLALALASAEAASPSGQLQRSASASAPPDTPRQG